MEPVAALLAAALLAGLLYLTYYKDEQPYNLAEPAARHAGEFKRIGPRTPEQDAHNRAVYLQPVSHTPIYM